MKKLIFILFTFSVYSVHAQFSISTYQAKERLPESNWLNPAFKPESKIVIGIPGLSSVGFDAGMGFSFNEAFKRDANDSLYLDTEDFPLNLKSKMDNSAEADVQLFLLGINTGDSYITVGSRLRSESRVNYPREFIQWALLGPGDDRISNIIDLNNIQGYTSTYIEYSAGIAHQLTDKMSLGIRVKYLNGILGGEGSQDGQLLISSDSVHLSINSSEYNIAGGSITNNFSPSSLFKSPNTGLGIDMGMEYKFNGNFSLSASVTDLGYIEWKSDIESYAIDNTSYTFSGVNLVDLLFTSGAGTPRDELDAFIAEVTPNAQNIESFRTGLNGKFASGLHYDLNLMGSVGATVYSGLNGGKLDPVLGLNYMLKVRSLLTVMAGLSYKDKTVTNIMTGLIVKPGPVQFYILTDRMNSFFSPSSAKTLNLRFGLNLAIGKSGSSLD